MKFAPRVLTRVVTQVHTSPMTQTATAAHFIGKCSAGHVHRYTAAEWAEASAESRTYSTAKYGSARCHCRTAITVRPIKARITEKECDGRCTGAVGPACDCKCGGENHGASHALVAA